MHKLLLTTAFLLLPALAPAQILGPVFPSGQPVIAGITPMAIGTIPLPMVWAFGNPGFGLAASTPAPIPPGFPTLLVIGPAVPPIPIPPPLVFGPFGAGMLTNLAPIAIPAGMSGPVVGPFVPLPIPPTMGPVGTFTAHTVVFAPGGLILTGAVGITI